MEVDVLPSWDLDWNGDDCIRRQDDESVDLGLDEIANGGRSESGAGDHDG